MNCPKQEVIEHYVLAQLEAEDLSEFEEHLNACESCRDRVAAARDNERLLTEMRTLGKEKTQLPEHTGTEVQTVDRAQSLLGSRYRVIRRVGEGSKGQVFQAVDTVLERLVAVKFLPHKSSVKAHEIDTWREARLMSQLNHPNIAQIYEIGEFENKRFIVMEWVDGLALTEAWKGLQLQQKLRIYLQVLGAVSVAHRRGIIHRDLKPSNILVTSELKAKVLDFGIAIETPSPESIEQGLYRGTPAYSAPEQVTPPVKVFPATDIFALGILLYQLLTDTLPFPQTETEELFEAIRNDYPELPSALQETIPIPLQNICLKALEKEPSKRYPDAQNLSDDIHRYLKGEKVWSRPSFLTDKIQQEVFYHRQKLKVWSDNELITEREFDQLENIYERIISPPDPSIIEARKLSLSQVCLYLGGWIVVLGCFVLFYKSWEQISMYLRPVPAIAAALLMVILGLTMWRRRESRLAVGFLATANLLIPITTLLTLGLWKVFSAAKYPLGTETIYEGLSQVESYLVVGNAQLGVSFSCWLLFSFIFLRITRSSIFVLFSTLAFLALLTTWYTIGGMEDWEHETIAILYLLPGIGLFTFGALLDHREYTQYASSLSMVGLVLMVVSLSALALLEKTLLFKPAFLDKTERVLLSFVCNGMVYLGVASICRLLGTSLQRSVSRIFNWLGPIHILAVLRILDSENFDLPDLHRLIYRILLPIASIAFVFGSVPRQMKSFFFSGLGGIAASVHKLTKEYLKDYFTWPVALIITGIIWMCISWLVPRWKASRALGRKESP